MSSAMNRPLTNVAHYAQMRSEVKTGDILFFDANHGFFSSIIRAATGRPTHGAIVMRTDADRVTLMESTLLLKGKRGVQCTYLSERVAEYDGSVWIGHLSPDVRRRVDVAKIEAWLLEQEGKRYDLAGAIYAGLDQLIPWLPECDYTRAYFCTRLCMAGLRHGGYAVDHDFSPTPYQLSQLQLFWRFSQIKGEYEPL